MNPAIRIRRTLTRSIRRRPAVTWAVGGAVFAIVMLSLVWPPGGRNAGGFGALAFTRASAPPGPVVITSVNTGFLWKVNELPPTSITVRNLIATPEKCRVWWMLSTPGSQDPWNHPTMLSTPTTVTVAALGSASVKANTIEPLIPSPWYYAFSVWTHCLDPSSARWRPSDGATVNGTVETLDPLTNLRHIRRASSSLWVNSITPTTRFAAHRSTMLKLVIANGTPNPVLVQIWSYLARPGVQQPWKSSGSTRSGVVNVSLSGAALTTVDVPMSKLPAAGRYVLSAWLHEIVVSASVPIDGAWLRHDVEVAPN
jgi:hypothetical protein